MGLIANIYRDGYESDCNVLKDAEQVTLVNVEGSFDPKPECPAALLVEGNLPGCVKVVAAKEVNGEYVEDRPEGAVGPMMGGAYVATSDSRFSEAIAALGAGHYGAVPLHDRYESVAQHAALSN